MPIAMMASGSIPTLIALSASICVIAEPKPLVDDLAGQVKDGGIVVQDEVGVGGQDDPVQLEGEPVRVLASGKLALV